MTEAEHYQSPQAEEAEAIKRIAGTADGLFLHRYLRRVLEGVFDIEADGALRVHTGRRTLARDLMRLMADGLNDDRSTDNAAILTRASARPVERRVSAREYFRTQLADEPAGE